MLSLSFLLGDSVRRHPHREAVVCGDTRLTYAELGSRVAHLADLLRRRGLNTGDRVALSCPNVEWFPIAYNAILEAGGIVVPLNVMLKAREVAYHLKDSGASLYLCYDGTEDSTIYDQGRAGFDDVVSCSEFIALRPGGLIVTGDGASHHCGDHLNRSVDVAVSPQASDTAVILYTSGTTGQPKGAELTHANMVLNAVTANRLFDSNPARQDSYLATLPLFHSFGQTVVMNAALATGSTLVMLPRFEPVAALKAMVTEAITVFAGVPTMYWALLDAVDETIDVERIAETLRAAISGGSALPLEILERVAERFDVQILEGYGLSETSPLALFTDPERAPRPGSIGVPVWGVQAMLVDEQGQPVEEPDAIGELAIRGHNVMKGYLNRPEATAEVIRNGWLRTGDLAKRDSDGFYYIVDRAKDLIVRSGFNVYPREVEEVLMSHASVSLAAVVGIPDERVGEEVVAHVIVDPGAEPVSAQELIDWCREVMASYKYPRRIEFVPTLPMTATGKILKRELIAPVAAAITG